MVQGSPCVGGTASASKQHQLCLGDDEMSWSWIVQMFPPLSEYAWKHSIVHFKKGVS